MPEKSVGLQKKWKILIITLVKIFLIFPENNTVFSQNVYKMEQNIRIERIFFILKIYDKIMKKRFFAI